MSTENERSRWRQVFHLILVPYDQPMSAVRMHAEANKDFHHTQAVRIASHMLIDPLLHAWQARPPEVGSDLSNLISPVYEAATSLDLNSTDIGQFARYIELVREAGASLNADDGDVPAASLADVLNDLQLDVKFAVLVARLGHNGILQLIDRRIADAGQAARRETSDPAPYLDLLTLGASEMSSYRTMSYSDIRSMADPGVATVEHYLHGDPDAERAPILQYFAAQWVTHVTTLWDEQYRPALAVLHGCEKNDVASELFADLNRMRQDYVHNRGITSNKQRRNMRLDWFAEGDPMIPSSANYDELFAVVDAEVAILAHAPTPKEKPNRTSVKGQIGVDLRRAFEAVAANAGLGADAALTEAISDWIASKRPKA